MFISKRSLDAISRAMSDDDTRPALFRGITVMPDGSAWGTNGHLAIKAKVEDGEVMEKNIEEVYDKVLTLPVTVECKLSVAYLRDICESILDATDEESPGVILTFHGEEKAITFKVDGTEIVGMLMPMRTNRK